MAGLSLHQPLPFAFGILGICFTYFTANDYFASITCRQSHLLHGFPRSDSYILYRKKSTEGFQSVPYVVALFSCMLWIYYAFVKTSSILLITINSFGLFIESTYIIMFLIYAPRKARISCVQMFVLLNVAAFAGIVLLTQLLVSGGSNRVRLLGWICVGFSISVFAAPLSVIRLVIRTKSVEFMPFFLTLSAVAWFGYGLFTKDIYVQLPNVLGFLFGMAQMLLYVVYKKKKNVAVEPAVAAHEAKMLGLAVAPTFKETAVENVDKKKKTATNENTDESDISKGDLRSSQLYDTCMRAFMGLCTVLPFTGFSTAFGIIRVISHCFMFLLLTSIMCFLMPVSPQPSIRL